MNRPMRIFYDHQVFSLQNAGGAARYHYELAWHLQNRFDVQIQIEMGLNQSIYPFSSLNGVRTHVVGRNTSLRPSAFRYAINEALSSMSSVTRRRVDIYHPTFYRKNPSVRHRCLVVTNHDCTHERFPQLLRNSGLVMRSKHKLFRSADAIICVSKSSKDDLLQFYDIDSAKVFVVHHGFSPLRLKDERSRNGSKDEGVRPYLLFVGFRGGYKNFDALLRVYAESSMCREYDLLTVGGGSFSPDEISRIQKLGLSVRVRNIQGVSDAELASIYGNAELFVYPSLYEGFGFPPLEAMSVGCPVLASAAGSLPEVCGNAACFFEASDLCDLQQRLETLLSSPDLRAKMSLNGYDQVRKYCWEQTASETFRVYQWALNHR